MYSYSTWSLSAMFSDHRWLDSINGLDASSCHNLHLPDGAPAIRNALLAADLRNHHPPALAPTNALQLSIAQGLRYWSTLPLALVVS
jgi:hypothetical protein